MIFVFPLLFLLEALFLCGHVGAQSNSIQILQDAALKWTEPLTCDKWDCNCTFTRQRGCCCAANDMYQLEEETFTRLKTLWNDVSQLGSRVLQHSESIKVAFKATMNPNVAVLIPGTNERCFGPFNTNVPLPYASVTLNHGQGYNPSLGVFTAPIAGVYLFSYTVYSLVEKDTRIYHKCQLMKNGNVTVSIWENNREDGEDSATQVVLLQMQRGDQVYVELMSGRKLCNGLHNNIFTGHIVYPDTD
ncbi:cerebellin 18 [Takifugu flavidus]|uniref:cerebellin 18 n=1 Tax=Takifugu flavidus TaxID=433684 RepID=UPI0025444E4B|nr:cerebellin 18 [Takifugu flavidus]